MARIKMHIFNVKLPFYPPCEVKYGLQNRVSTIVYASQRLRHYFLAYEVWLMTKSHVIKVLLWQPIFSSRISQ